MNLQNWLDLELAFPLKIMPLGRNAVGATVVRKVGCGDGASIALMVHMLTHSLDNKVLFLTNNKSKVGNMKFHMNTMMSDGVMGSINNIYPIIIRSSDHANAAYEHHRDKLIFVDCDFYVRQAPRFRPDIYGEF